MRPHALLAGTVLALATVLCATPVARADPPRYGPGPPSSSAPAPGAGGYPGRASWGAGATGSPSYQDTAQRQSRDAERLRDQAEAQRRAESQARVREQQRAQEQAREQAQQRVQAQQRELDREQVRQREQAQQRVQAQQRELDRQQAQQLEQAQQRSAEQTQQRERSRELDQQREQARERERRLRDSVPPIATVTAPQVAVSGEHVTVLSTCSTGSWGRLSATGPVGGGAGPFRIDDDARPGSLVGFTVTCTDAAGRASTARADTQVRAKPDLRPAWVELDPGSGRRDERIAVLGFCPDGGDARLESDAVRDAPLRRDGPRLVGDTRARPTAPLGKVHAYLVCQNGDRARDEFTVERDRRDRFVDLEPDRDTDADRARMAVPAVSPDRPDDLGSSVLSRFTAEFFVAHGS